MVLAAVLGVACTTPDVSSKSSNLNGKRQPSKTKNPNDDDPQAEERDMARRESSRDARGTDDVAPSKAAPSQCRTDGECGGAGRICEGTTCMKGCRNDVGCAASQSCIAGQCASKTTPNGQCSEDLECPLGQICNLTRCQVGCRTTGDCPLEESCQSGQCFFDPSSGGTSSGGTSSGGAISCTADADCALGKICTSRACTPGCKSDLDCPGTDICSSGTCI